jgi:hypothetical protein
LVKLFFIELRTLKDSTIVFLDFDDNSMRGKTGLVFEISNI